ncbi:hypothetical protein [Vibrio sp. F74]|uniref:hypothetical protein n=1 Tax=Vibrio sp. F74 TaxID=700020 RepID=UPI0035F55AEA
MNITAVGELKQVQDKAWKDGIYIDDLEWELLKKNAAVILVENSQRSIQGAGEIVSLLRALVRNKLTGLFGTLKHNTKRLMRYHQTL